MMDIIQKHWKLFLAEGIFFILLGLLAVALPVFFTLSVELFVGWLLVFGGIVQAYRTFQIHPHSGFYPSLIAAVAAIIAGVLLLVYPLKGILTLTLLLAIYFLVEGISKIITASLWRPITNWGWLFVSGILSVVLAGIIFAGFPGTATWVIGLLVGINMLFLGWTLVLMSLRRQ